jgi:hypothetical protein
VDQQLPVTKFHTLVLILKALPVGVSRRGYLALGVACFSFKYGFNWLVARFVFSRDWSPFNYLQPLRYYEAWSVPTQDAAFLLSLLALSIPFMVVGVLATLGRLRSAGLSPVMALIFFAPGLNLLFFLTLAAVPPAKPFDPHELSPPRDPASPQSLPFGHIQRHHGAYVFVR